MSWIIEGDIAIYRVKNFCMVKKFRVVEVSPDNYVLRDKVIYIDDIKTQAAIKSFHEAKKTYIDALKEAKSVKPVDAQMTSFIKEENDKIINPIEIDEITVFSKYMFRECEWCGVEFLKTTVDRVVCSGKCRTAMTRVRNDIREAIIKKSDKETCANFPNGFVSIGDKYDMVSYKKSSCEISGSPHQSRRSLMDEREWIFYYEKEDDLLTVCDIKGELLPRQLIFIYKESMELKGMERALC